MDPNTYTRLLHNSGLTDATIEGSDIVFTDPSCIFPAFDTFFNYAWIVAMVLTVIILFQVISPILYLMIISVLFVKMLMTH